MIQKHGVSRGESSSEQGTVKLLQQVISPPHL